MEGNISAQHNHHRGRKTNTATSMATTVVTMAIMVSMEMNGRGEWGQRRTLDSAF